MVLSLIAGRCGGVGLNITGANRVIIFDPSWPKQRTGESQFHILQFATSRFHFNVYALQCKKYVVVLTT